MNTQFYPQRDSTNSPKHPSRFLYNSPPQTNQSSPTISLLTNQSSSTFSTAVRRSLLQQELALIQEALEETNIAVVAALYEALSSRDADKIRKILAPDLEWWFHGPPSHQFLMRLLTGSKEKSFRFVPHSISAVGSVVLAEGFEQRRTIAWVHAWTVTDGLITQVREYFNTSLTVTRVGKSGQSDCAVSPLYCPCVWESSLPGRVGKSVPGVLLAI